MGIVRIRKKCTNIHDFYNTFKRKNKNKKVIKKKESNLHSLVNILDALTPESQKLRRNSSSLMPGLEIGLKLHTAAAQFTLGNYPWANKNKKHTYIKRKKKFNSHFQTLA